MQKVARTSIIDLLAHIKKKTGKSSAQIAKELGLGKHDVDNAGRLEGIKRPLVDWILRETYASEDPQTQVFLWLDRLDLRARQVDSIKEMIRTFLEDQRTQTSEETRPAGTVIEAKEVAGRIIKHYTPPPSAKDETSKKKRIVSEPQAPYAQKPNSNLEQDAFEWVRGLNVKRSSEFDISKAAPPPKTAALPIFDEKAAANHMQGTSPTALGPVVAETQPSEVKYDRKNHYVLEVTGRSLHPYVMSGDRIIVERKDLYLPTYDENFPIDKQAWEALDNKLVVAVKNQDVEAYVKRLSVQKSKGGSILVDLLSFHPKAKPIKIRKEDSLKVVGVVKEILRNPDNMDV